MKFKSKMEGSNAFSFRGMTSVVLKKGEISSDLSVIVSFDKTFKKLLSEGKIEAFYSPSEKSFLKESGSMNVYQISAGAAKIENKKVHVPKLDPIELAKNEVSANIRTIEGKKAQLEYLLSISKELKAKIGKKADGLIESIKKEFGLNNISEADLMVEPSLLSEDTLDSFTKDKEETDKIVKEKTASLKVKKIADSKKKATSKKASKSKTSKSSKKVSSKKTSKKSNK